MQLQEETRGSSTDWRCVEGRAGENGALRDGLLCMEHLQMPTLSLTSAVQIRGRERQGGKRAPHLFVQQFFLG